MTTHKKSGWGQPHPLEVRYGAESYRAIYVSRQGAIHTDMHTGERLNGAQQAQPLIQKYSYRFMLIPAGTRNGVAVMRKAGSESRKAHTSFILLENQTTKEQKNRAAP